MDRFDAVPVTLSEGLCQRPARFKGGMVNSRARKKFPVNESRSVKRRRREFLRGARPVRLEIKQLSFFLLNRLCTHIVEGCGKEFPFLVRRTPCAFEIADL